MHLSMFVTLFRAADSVRDRDPGEGLRRQRHGGAGGGEAPVERLHHDAAGSDGDRDHAPAERLLPGGDAASGRPVRLLVDGRASPQHHRDGEQAHHGRRDRHPEG